MTIPTLLFCIAIAVMLLILFDKYSIKKEAARSLKVINNIFGSIKSSALVIWVAVICFFKDDNK